MTRTGHLALFVPLGLAVAVSVARAQTPTRPTQPTQPPQTQTPTTPAAPGTKTPAAATPAGRFILTAIGGTSFGNTEASALLGGGIGVELSPHVQIGAEVGHDGNLTTKTLHDNLRDASAGLSPTAGAAVSYAVSAPEVYGLGDVRYWVQTSPHVGVFIKVGAGVAHVAPHFSAAANGTDLTGQVLALVPIPATETSFMASFDGGLSFRLGSRSSIEGGYRYTRINSTTPLNTNGLYAALQAKF